MSTRLQQIFARRIVSIVFGLLGLWMLISAVGAHFDGLAKRHVEYAQNIPIFIIFSVLLGAIGGALLIAAWRLWRLPPQKV